MITISYLLVLLRLLEDDLPNMLRRFARKARRFKEQKVKEGKDAYVILDGCTAVYDSGKYCIGAHARRMEI
jgi:hypothetical protein